MNKDEQLAPWEARGIQHGFSAPQNPPRTPPEPIVARQVHGIDVVEVTHKTSSPAGDADALISLAPGVAVGIATADCVPILLTTSGAEAVAAIHAGWRGTLAAIASRAIDAMEARGIAPSKLEAAIGPAIGPCCFEVEDEFRARFVDTLGHEAREYWQDGRDGHGTLDLRRLNRMLLERSGVPSESIHLVGPCTFCGGGPYASYRRQGQRAGRQISWIRTTG